MLSASFRFFSKGQILLLQALLARTEGGLGAGGIRRNTPVFVPKSLHERRRVRNVWLMWSLSQISATGCHSVQGNILILRIRRSSDETNVTLLSITSAHCGNVLKMIFSIRKRAKTLFFNAPAGVVQ